MQPRPIHVLAALFTGLALAAVAGLATASDESPSQPGEAKVAPASESESRAMASGEGYIAQGGTLEHPTAVDTASLPDSSGEVTNRHATEAPPQELIQMCRRLIESGTEDAACDALIERWGPGG